MINWGLVGLVLALVTAAVVMVMVIRRRSAAPVPGGPRTVAELVALRVEAGHVTPVIRTTGVGQVGEHADPGPLPVPPAVTAAVEASRADPVVARIPVARAAEAGAGVVDGPERPAGATGPDATLPDGTLPDADRSTASTELMRAASTDLPGVALPCPGHGGDTPWGRAALMTGRAVLATPAEPGSPAAAESMAELPPTEPATPVEPVLPVEPAVVTAVVTAGVTAPALTAPAPTAPALTAVAAEGGGPVAVHESPGVPRPRRSDADTAAEQAAVDLSLTRTFGLPRHRGSGSVPAGPLASSGSGSGASWAVRFRTVARDGSLVAGASVRLLDDHGREITSGAADAGGRGELCVPRPGSYMVVSTAPDHQPGAVAVTVTDTPVDADVLLAPSASLAGTVYSEDGPVLGAKLTLVQDGEVVDAVDSGEDGAYRIGDLAAGDYELSVSADGCEPVTALLDVPDATDLRHDVDLDPAGLPADGVAAGGDLIDDLMIGYR